MNRTLAKCSVLAVLVAAVVPGACAGAQSLRGAVRLVPFADVDTPTAMATRANDDSLYVAEQEGRVVSVDEDGDVTTVLDFSTRVLSGGEQGFLGLAFSPDGSHLYVHYTNKSSNTRVDEYAVEDGDVVRSSRRTVLRVRQPQPNHNGGQLAFGPDGMLYLALGDGGGAGDEGEGHAPGAGGNGQSLDTLLGKIVRIDPTPSGDDVYTIPGDNPFANGGGKPEIWAYGLRNPWRFSFDRETGDLWIGDVGQQAWEEIDVAPADDGGGRGVNFGWSVFEADAQYREGDAAGAQPPLVGLNHDEGYCSVIGGYVYRGSRIADLVGSYVYSDYCNGELRFVRNDGNDVDEEGSLGVELDDIASFGEGPDGELYVLSQSSGMYRIASA